MSAPMSIDSVPILGIYSGFPALFDRRGNAIVVFHPTPYASPAKQWSKAVKDVAALRREIARRQECA